jgi:hypothetical protein
MENTKSLSTIVVGEKNMKARPPTREPEKDFHNSYPPRVLVRFRPDSGALLGAP